LQNFAEQKWANCFAVALGGLADAGLLSRLRPITPLALKAVAPTEVGQLFDMDLSGCGCDVDWLGAKR